MSGDRADTDPEIDADTVDDYSTPLPPAALQTGAGSGLDADTLQGNTPTDLGGVYSPDGNSPQTTSGATSHTLTLADTYDHWWINVQITETSGGGAGASTIDLRANGVTSGYAYNDEAGTYTSSASSVSGVGRVNPGNTVVIPIMCAGRWAGDDWSGHSLYDTPGSYSPATAFGNFSMSGPLNSLTILSSNSTDVTFHAYGTDVGGAGVP